MLTAATVTVNPPVAEPDRIVVPPATVTAGLLLARDTRTLLLVVDVRYTEQASVPGALKVFRPQEIRLSVGVAEAADTVASSPIKHRKCPRCLRRT